MRTLYLDCGMGAAGDMLTAALYELLSEKDKAFFMERMNSLGIDDLKVTAEKMTKCGIVGTHMKVEIGDEEESEDMHTLSHEHDHSHEHTHEHSHEHSHNHDHEHSHTHSHNSMSDIRRKIRSLPISAITAKNAVDVYKLIAEAESNAHGVEVSEIHFHEVGTMDAIADVTAVCILIEMLNVEKIVSSPVHVGSGHVHCAHGILPVPAPATAYILKDVPIYGGEIKGELCTPTGAALLKHFVNEFGEMPPMKVEKIGYGMGKKDFSMANCVRAMIGETFGSKNQIIELSCNIDDMTPERIGFAMDRMFDLGALDAYTIPIGMKKSRPGILLSVICKEENRDEIVNAIFKHTTTLGIRENVSNRYTLERSIKKVNTQFGEVRVKHSEGYGITRDKYEYDDLSRLAKENDMSIDDVVKKIENRS